MQDVRVRYIENTVIYASCQMENDSLTRVYADYLRSPLFAALVDCASQAQYFRVDCVNDLGMDDSLTDIGGRIEIACDIAGGKKKLADMAGVSESQLHRYIAGTSQPTISPLVAIALAAGVRLEWLATGRLPAIMADSSEGRRPGSIAELASLREFAKFRKRRAQDIGVHEALEEFVKSYNKLDPDIERIAGHEFIDLAEVSDLFFKTRAVNAEISGEIPTATPRDDELLSLPVLTALLVAMDSAGLTLRAEERAEVLAKAHSIILLTSKQGVATVSSLSEDDLRALVSLVAKLRGHGGGVSS